MLTPQRPSFEALRGSQCEFQRHPGSYLGEFAEGTSTETRLDEAQRRCKDLEESCVGITCTSALVGCSPRRGTPFLAFSPTGEVSFVKTCTGASEPEVDEGAGDESARFPGDFPLTQASPPLPAKVPDSGGRQLLSPGRAVLAVIAHNQVDCLQKCLESIAAQPRSDRDAVDVAVSLDDPPSFQRMEAVVSQFHDRMGKAIKIWQKPAEAALKPPKTLPVSKISEHFRFALTESFERHGYEYAIFLENDLTVAPDFLWYFRATAPLLQEDPTLFCISAWNDNGFRGVVSNERRLFRTDYFPGLGWMVRNDTWGLVRNRWPRFPSTGWDHWLRHGSGLRPRECIVPEVPRTHHFGTQGANVKKGSALAKMLERMEVSRLEPGYLGDLSYLLQANYEAELRVLIQKAGTIRRSSLQLAERARGRGKFFVVPYSREEYKDVAKRLQISAAQPRTAHRGVVITRHPQSRAVVILVDRRQAEGLLPDEELWRPHPRRQVGKAGPGDSCDGHCAKLGMRCEAKELEFVNNCEALQKEFPCEDGCGHQVGQEIPAYVHDRGRDTALQCLVTDDAIPTCSAHVPVTTRLCACVPL